MKDDNGTPTINLSKIQFPMDSVTLGQMRAFDSSYFTHKNLSKDRAYRIDAVATHTFELVLAEKTFARMKGLTDPHPNSDRKEIMFMLNGGYKEYEISSGMQQTKQLYREIENQVISQAKLPDSYSR